MSVPQTVITDVASHCIDRNRSRARFLAIVVLWFSACVPGWSEGPGQAVIMEVELDNLVEYWDDVAEPARLVTRVEATPPAVRNFMRFLVIADIVAVNGKPAKGIFVQGATNLRLTTNPAAGEAMGDVIRSTLGDYRWEIQQSDGTPVGTIIAAGLGGGTSPPGSPVAAGQHNAAVIGGTGAYVGMRGQVVVGSRIKQNRAASMAEDPRTRRTYGGGALRWVFSLLPMNWPEIVGTSSGPAVFHEDFSQVTSARPARAGEPLILMATGLGPTRPALQPQQKFRDEPMHVVNSPLHVTVNGASVEVMNKVGWPTTSDTYRVDIRLPEATTPGMAAIQLSAAWIPGAEVRIPVR